MTPQLGFILSLPRSGSTVLSVLLDKRRGIVSPPESSFPQVLGETKGAKRKDKRWLAALYLGATFPPTPLTLQDAEACMDGDDQEILIRLGHAVAAKLGRPADEIRAVVWKTPRTICMNDGPLATNGRFIILRRNPHNVFESQFRVDFGKNNRNPFRFAVFRESYELAFSQIPAARRMDVHYDDLPGIVPRICEYLHVPEAGEWGAGPSSLDLAAESCYWLTEVTKEFRNNDPEKRARLDPAQVRKLDMAMTWARPLRSMLGPVRRHYDVASLKDISKRARQHYGKDA